MRRLLLALLIVFAACESSDRARPPAAVQVLDINRASVAELEKLPGIGPKRARSIIAARNARRGRFTSYEQILSIDGIGPETMEKIRPLIELGPPN